MQNYAEPHEMWPALQGSTARLEERNFRTAGGRMPTMGMMGMQAEIDRILDRILSYQHLHRFLNASYKVNVVNVYVKSNDMTGTLTKAHKIHKRRAKASQEEFSMYISKVRDSVKQKCGI
jgi:hypothetical protein